MTWALGYTNRGWLYRISRRLRWLIRGRCAACGLVLKWDGHCPDSRPR